MAYKRANRDVSSVMADVPAIPTLCGVTGCNSKLTVIGRDKKGYPIFEREPDECHVLFMTASRDGRAVTGSPSSFCESIGNEQYAMRPGWSFVNWISRCATCYERDMIRSGKTQGVES